jgi:hypothetical protein
MHYWHFELKVDYLGAKLKLNLDEDYLGFHFMKHSTTGMVVHRINFQVHDF